MPLSILAPRAFQYRKRIEGPYKNLKADSSLHLERSGAHCASHDILTALAEIVNLLVNVLVNISAVDKIEI